MYTIKDFYLARFLRCGKCEPSPQGERTQSSAEFFDNLSRFGGVSEAIAEREPTGEILRGCDFLNFISKPTSKGGVFIIRSQALASAKIGS